MRLFHALVGILCLSTSTVHAQVYGEWDRPCTLQLPPRFSWPFVSGVIYGGHEWLTSWRSIDQTPPLPSNNWYEATPVADPTSTDGGAKWIGAKVQGHCTIERTPYYITSHTYPVAFGGRVVSCPSSGGGGGVWDLQPEFDVYGDDYDPYFSGSGGECTSDDDGESGTGGGDGPTGSGIAFGPGDYTGGETVDWNTGVGNGGSSVCGLAARVEYICIDTYVDGIGWVEWSCGYATTC